MLLSIYAHLDVNEFDNMTIGVKLEPCIPFTFPLQVGWMGREVTEQLLNQQLHARRGNLIMT